MEDRKDKTQVNECIGVGRGGRTTKIHVVVDALGNPIEVLLTTGNTSDITVAEKLLSRISLKGATVLADRAYGKWTLREYIANHDADFCILPKKKEKKTIPTLGMSTGGCIRNAIL